MNAEEYLKEFRQHAIEVVDDEAENIDFRCHMYYQHIGRIEAVFVTNQITWKRYSELMDEWKTHWPFNTRRTK